MRIKAFEALRPREDLVEQVASVPYDTVTSEEARQAVEGNPWSFLHVIRAEVDLPLGADPHSDDAYEKSRENFVALQDQGVLIREEDPCVYVYRQTMGEHSQVGVVACCHVADYRNHVILQHERTRADKEEDRARHVRTLRANTGPVFLTYRDDGDVDACVEAVLREQPLYDVQASDGVRHTVWRVCDGEELVRAFACIPCAYIADGHHRSAAAARAAAQLSDAHPEAGEDAEHNWFLTVLFPAQQLQILPYNRCIKDLNGRTEAQFLVDVREQFTVTEMVQPEPNASCHVGMYLAGKWYGLSWDEPVSDDPVKRLDVSMLQEKLLAPVLGIDDPRTSDKIEFVGGIKGPDALALRVDSGEMAVAFSMYPVTVDQMMAISDADAIMPPKSTWFEPKLRSGLLVHTL